MEIQSKMNTEQKLALIKIGHPKHLDTLVHDSNPYVRWHVAYSGNDKHRDTLVHDKDPYVRWRVAKCGNKDHATKLSKDSDSNVRKAAKRRLKELG